MTPRSCSAAAAAVYPLCFWPQIAQLVGPVTPLKRSNLARHSMQRHSKPTMNACEMVSVERGQGIAVCLETTRNLEGDYAFVQVNKQISGWRHAQETEPDLVIACCSYMPRCLLHSYLGGVGGSLVRRRLDSVQGTRTYLQTLVYSPWRHCSTCVHWRSLPSWLSDQVLQPPVSRLQNATSINCCESPTNPDLGKGQVSKLPPANAERLQVCLADGGCDLQSLDRSWLQGVLSEPSSKDCQQPAEPLC